MSWLADADSDVCSMMSRHLSQGLLSGIPAGSLSIGRVHAGLDGAGNLVLVLLLPAVGLVQPEPGAHIGPASNGGACGTSYMTAASFFLCITPEL